MTAKRNRKKIPCLDPRTCYSVIPTQLQNVNTMPFSVELYLLDPTGTPYTREQVILTGIPSNVTFRAGGAVAAVETAITWNEINNTVVFTPPDDSYDQMILSSFDPSVRGMAGEYMGAVGIACNV